MFGHDLGGMHMNQAATQPAAHHLILSQNHGTKTGFEMQVSPVNGSE